MQDFRAVYRGAEKRPLPDGGCDVLPLRRIECGGENLAFKQSFQPFEERLHFFGVRICLVIGSIWLPFRS